MAPTSLEQLGVVVLSVGIFLEPVLLTCTPYVHVVGTLHTAFRLCRAGRDAFDELISNPEIFLYVLFAAFSVGLGIISPLEGGYDIHRPFQWNSYGFVLRSLVLFMLLHGPFDQGAAPRT